MSEIDELLEKEKARLIKELKELERGLGKGIPLSYESETLVHRLVEHALNARVREFSSKRVREHLKSLKDCLSTV